MAQVQAKQILANRISILQFHQPHIDVASGAPEAVHKVGGIWGVKFGDQKNGW
jgi:hypothetical protein